MSIDQEGLSAVGHDVGQGTGAQGVQPRGR